MESFVDAWPRIPLISGASVHFAYYRRSLLCMFHSYLIWPICQKVKTPVNTKWTNKSLCALVLLMRAHIWRSFSAQKYYRFSQFIGVLQRISYLSGIISESSGSNAADLRWNSTIGIENFDSKSTSIFKGKEDDFCFRFIRTTDDEILEIN